MAANLHSLDQSTSILENVSACISCFPVWSYFYSLNEQKLESGRYSENLTSHEQQLLKGSLTTLDHLLPSHLYLWLHQAHMYPTDRRFFIGICQNNTC